MISEHTLDNFFPRGQFLIKAFGTPFHFHRNRNGNGSGIMLYICSYIPAKIVSTEGKAFERIYVELNL